MRWHELEKSKPAFGTLCLCRDDGGRVYHVWNNIHLGHIGTRRCMAAIFGVENGEDSNKHRRE